MLSFLISITDLSSNPTLRELRQLPVTKWYNLGLQLEVNQEELEKIQSKHPQNDRICQTKMFGVWVREVENPNYEKLLKALAAIGRRDIAEFVCDKEGNTTKILEIQLCSQFFFTCSTEKQGEPGA